MIYPEEQLEELKAQFGQVFGNLKKAGMFIYIRG